MKQRMIRWWIRNKKTGQSWSKDYGWIDAGCILTFYNDHQKAETNLPPDGQWVKY